MKALRQARLIALLLGLVFLTPPDVTRATTNCIEQLQSPRSVSFVELKNTLKRIVNEEINVRIHKNQLQEALWISTSIGDVQTASVLRRYLESALKRSRILSTQPANMGGISETLIVELAGGIKGIFKPDPEFWTIKNVTYAGWASNSRAEVDAYKVSQLLNIDLVPLTVDRIIDNKRGSLQIFVQQGGGYATNDFLQLMKALDYLINNRDRHGGNYLYFNSRPVAIDHGLSFQPLANPKGHNVPWTLDMFSFTEFDRPLFEALSAPDFEGKLRSILTGRHEEIIIDEILQRRQLMLEAMQTALQKQAS